MPFEYTQEEWMTFTKTQRKIISLIRAHNYAKDHICQYLEIGPSTYRTHIAAIKRNMAEIKRIRSVTAMHQMENKVNPPEEPLTPIVPESAKEKTLTKEEQLRQSFTMAAEEGA